MSNSQDPTSSTNKKKGARTATERALGDTLDFMRLLWAVDHALQSTSKRMEHALGLTGPQRLVVRLVGRFPDISAGELANLLEIHPSTLTGILRRLESRDVLTRRADPADGRRALFTLTAAGTELDHVNEGTVESAVAAALTRLGPEQLDATRTVLGALRVALIGQLDPPSS